MDRDHASDLTRGGGVSNEHVILCISETILIIENCLSKIIEVGLDMLINSFVPGHYYPGN